MTTKEMLLDYNSSTIQELMNDPSSLINQQNSKNSLKLLNRPKEEINIDQLLKSNLVQNSSQLIFQRNKNSSNVSKENKNGIAREKIYRNEPEFYQNTKMTEEYDTSPNVIRSKRSRTYMTNENIFSKKKSSKNLQMERLETKPKNKSSHKLFKYDNPNQFPEPIRRRTVYKSLTTKKMPRIYQDYIFESSDSDSDDRNYQTNEKIIQSTNTEGSNKGDETQNYIVKKRTAEKSRRRSRRNSELNNLAVTNMLKQSEVNTDYSKKLNSLKWIDIFISITLTINIILTILDNEIYINYSDDYLKNYMEKTGRVKIQLDDLIFIETRILNPIENLLRILNGGLSFLAGVLIIFHYRKKVEIQKLDKTLSEHDTIWTSGLFPSLLLDIFVAIIFYPPFINKIMSGRMLGLIYGYNLNSIFSVVVMIKFYLVSRAVKYFSRWTSGTAEAICNNYKVKSGINFAIKAEMNKRPATILSALLFVSMGLLAFSVRSFEYGVIDPETGTEGVKGNNDLQNLANCFWLIIVTMTTVGFGDFYPRSHLGRFIGVIACIIGMLLLSLIVVSLSSITEFTHEETKAFGRLKKLFSDDNLEKKAANVIIKVLQLRKNIDGFFRSRSTFSYSEENPLMERFVYLTQLKKEISIFKNDIKIANSHSLPVDEMLKRLEDTLKDDILKLTKNLQEIKDLDNELDELADDQKDVQSTLVDVMKMQEDISKYVVEVNNQNYLQNLMRKKKLEEESKKIWEAEIKSRKERLRSSRSNVPNIEDNKSVATKKHISSKKSFLGSELNQKDQKEAEKRKSNASYAGNQSELKKKSSKMLGVLQMDGTKTSRRNSAVKNNSSHLESSANLSSSNTITNQSENKHLRLSKFSKVNIILDNEEDKPVMNTIELKETDKKENETGEFSQQKIQNEKTEKTEKNDNEQTENEQTEQKPPIIIKTVIPGLNTLDNENTSPLKSFLTIHDYNFES